MQQATMSRSGQRNTDVLRVLTVVVIAIILSGMMYSYLRNLGYEIPIPEKTANCAQDAKTIGLHMDACASVDSTQAKIMFLSLLLTSVTAMLLLCFIRNKGIWEMISQWNKVDHNNSPAKLFMGMAVVGLVFTMFLGVSSPEAMLYTMLMRYAMFYLVGTPAALLANILMRGNVKSIRDWIDRFEQQGTDGPVYITLFGYLFGLIAAMALL